MILPNKNQKLRFSLLGTGSKLLEEMKVNHTVSSLWESVKESSEINNFEKFILTLDMLYALKAVTYINGQLIRNENSKSI